MSRFSGPQYRGAMRDLRAQRHAEAVERNGGKRCHVRCRRCAKAAQS